MQTFLPHSRFGQSARVLDYRRLGKQRVEAKQLLKALGAYPPALLKPEEARPRPGSGWANHPAARMWAENTAALSKYHNVVIDEWEARGYNNTMPRIPLPNVIAYPSWLGDPDFHASHRSNLLRKDLEYYSQFNWSEPDNLEYIWP